MLHLGVLSVYRKLDSKLLISPDLGSHVRNQVHLMLIDKLALNRVHGPVVGQRLNGGVLFQ
jgi:hypothetical protein